ncbi:hypothetical protein M5D96_011376, partial [Drosophila gunungcola]
AFYFSSSSGLNSNKNLTSKPIEPLEPLGQGVMRQILVVGQRRARSLLAPELLPFVEELHRLAGVCRNTLRVGVRPDQVRMQQELLQVLLVHAQFAQQLAGVAPLQVHSTGLLAYPGASCLRLWRLLSGLPCLAALGSGGGRRCLPPDRACCRSCSLWPLASFGRPAGTGPVPDGPSGRGGRTSGSARTGPGSRATRPSGRWPGCCSCPPQAPSPHPGAPWKPRPAKGSTCCAKSKR